MKTTNRKHNQYINNQTSKQYFKCAICGESFNSDRQLSEHIARDHEKFTEQLINLYNSQDDFGYFMSCLKYEQDHFLTERWQNS